MGWGIALLTISHTALEERDKATKERPYKNDQGDKGGEWGRNRGRKGEEKRERRGRQRAEKGQTKGREGEKGGVTCRSCLSSSNHVSLLVANA